MGDERLRDGGEVLVAVDEGGPERAGGGSDDGVGQGNAGADFLAKLPSGLCRSAATGMISVIWR